MTEFHLQFHTGTAKFGIATPQAPETAEAEKDLRGAEDHVWAAEVIVTSIVPELEMAVASTADDTLEVHLWKDTKGLRGNVLAEGQHVIVSLKGVLAPEVLRAELARA